MNENTERIITYPKMNREIVDLLRQSGGPMQLYAAQRIEELETEIQKLTASQTNARLMHCARRLDEQEERVGIELHRAMPDLEEELKDLLRFASQEIAKLKTPTP